MSIVATRYGPFRIIDTDSVISRSLREYGEWAQKEIDCILHFIKSGDRVADVGAFIGTHSRAFSSAVGCEGRVYAFEPRKEIVEILLENTTFCIIENITIFQYALGREHHDLEIFTVPERRENNYGGFSLKVVHGSGEAFNRIQLVTLDELNIDHLDVIKIDVEGMESDVLLGAEAIIARDRPIVFAEVNSLQSGLPLLHWCEHHQYVMFCALHPAYNPQNFAVNPVNFFLDAIEINALLMPGEKWNSHADWIRAQCMAPAHSPDDLVLILLHKPQYVGEVLKNSNSAAVLRTDFLEQHIDERLAELHGLRQLLTATENAKEVAEHLAYERLAELQILHRKLADRQNRGWRRLAGLWEWTVSIAGRKAP